jgi:hypothetical protein
VEPEQSQNAHSQTCNCGTDAGGGPILVSALSLETSRRPPTPPASLDSRRGRRSFTATAHRSFTGCTGRIHPHAGVDRNTSTDTPDTARLQNPCEPPLCYLAAAGASSSASLLFLALRVYARSTHLGGGEGGGKGEEGQVGVVDMRVGGAKGWTGASSDCTLGLQSDVGCSARCPGLLLLAQNVHYSLVLCVLLVHRPKLDLVGPQLKAGAALRVRVRGSRGG